MSGLQTHINPPPPFFWPVQHKNYLPRVPVALHVGVFALKGLGVLVLTLF